VTEFDQEVIDILVQDNVPFILIANKCDNLKANEQKYAVQKIRHAVNDLPDVPIVLYSSKTGVGRNELTSRIFDN
jgi:GTP-binding protein EngB required for normal cell division